MRISKPPKERRAELIFAARRLFDLNGVENTRVSDIVREVGVAQGVFYYYFKSKNEMVAIVTRQVRDEMEAAAQAFVERTDLPFCQRLTGIIELYIQLIDQFLADDESRLPNPARLLEEDEGTSGQARALLTQKMLALVRQGAAEGIICVRYPEEAALVTLWGLHFLAGQQLPTHALIFALVEQNLGLPAGALAPYALPQSQDKT